MGAKIVYNHKAIEKKWHDKWQENPVNPRFRDNGEKKEKYYCLTRKGKKIFKEHQKRHKLWVKRDTEFFKRYPVIELQYVKEFMKDYNQYLEEQIKSIEK